MAESDSLLGVRLPTVPKLHQKGETAAFVVSPFLFCGNEVLAFGCRSGEARGACLAQHTKKAVSYETAFLVVPPGIEPGTQGFSVLCSTN